jgi:hypothetical protein
LLLYLEKLKNCIKVFEKSTSYDKETIDFIVGFVLNDFGFRGVLVYNQQNMVGQPI